MSVRTIYLLSLGTLCLSISMAVCPQAFGQEPIPTHFESRHPQPSAHSAPRRASGAHHHAEPMTHRVVKKSLETSARKRLTSSTPVPKPSPSPVVPPSPARLDQDFLTCASNGDLDRMKHFLGIGVSLDSVQQDKTTALMLASQNDRMNIVQFLVADRKVNVNATNDDGRSALSFAALAGNDDVVDYLLKNGADINHQDNPGNTPLMLAVKYLHEPTVTRFLIHGADVNLPDDSSNSPLIEASKAGALDITKDLIGAHAVLTQKNMNGETALQKAVALSHTAIADALRSAGAAQ